MKKGKPQTFYDSDEWRTVRYQALRKSRGCCDCCGVRASKDKPLHVDHIKPRSKYPSLELSLSNLQVLCGDCNLGKSNNDEIDWRGTERAQLLNQWREWVLNASLSNWAIKGFNEEDCDFLRKWANQVYVSSRRLGGTRT